MHARRGRRPLMPDADECVRRNTNHGTWTTGSQSRALWLCLEKTLLVKYDSPCKNTRHTQLFSFWGGCRECQEPKMPFLRFMYGLACFSEIFFLLQNATVGLQVTGALNKRFHTEPGYRSLACRSGRTTTSPRGTGQKCCLG